MPLKSDLPDIVVEKTSVHSAIFQALAAHGQGKAVVDLNSGVSYDFREVIDHAKVVACGLRRLGVGKGDVVAICLPNCAEYTILMLGTMCIGAAFSGVNPNYTESELCYHFDACRCRCVVTDGVNYAKCSRAMTRRKAPSDRNCQIILTTKAKQEQSDAAIWSDVFNTNDKFDELPDVEIDPTEDIAMLPSSSGTTGFPKCVLISHFALLLTVRGFGNSKIFIAPDTGENCVCYLPLFHVFGAWLTLASFLNGSTLILLPRFEPKSFLGAIQKYKVPKLFVVPPTLSFLAKDQLVEQYDLSCVRAILVGAAPVGRDLSEAVFARFPHMQHFSQSLGMTECGLLMDAPKRPREEIVHGSCGRIIPGVQLKIVSLDGTGKELGPNVDGEVCVKTGALMKGYLNQPEATAAMFDADGWLHTGDVGHYDNHRNIFVIDRLKEIMKVKGFQVAPAELEDVLLSHPSLADAAVIGVPDDVCGEVPHAFVVVELGHHRIAESELLAYANGQLATFKHIHRVQYVESIPRTASGKIQRRFLRQTHMQKSKI